jgi:hypothetical protein
MPSTVPRTPVFAEPVLHRRPDARFAIVAEAEVRPIDEVFSDACEKGPAAFENMSQERETRIPS